MQLNSDEEVAGGGKLNTGGITATVRDDMEWRTNKRKNGRRRSRRRKAALLARLRQRQLEEMKDRNSVLSGGGGGGGRGRQAEGAGKGGHNTAAHVDDVYDDDYGEYVYDAFNNNYDYNNGW